MKVERPIFVFGCNNSGTTILWQALKKHQDLRGPVVEDREIEDMPVSMKHGLGKATFRLWAHPMFKLCYYATEHDHNAADAQKIKEIYQRFLDPGTRLIAKTPSHTLRTRLIQIYFPDAYFVAIVRNGYAVSEGTVRKRKYDAERPQFQGLFTTIEQAAEHWLRANMIVVSNQKFLRNYLIVKYENLVENPGETLGNILDFCGLEKTGFPIPAFEQGKNAEQIARLSSYDIEIVTRTAGPMLLHFEYDLHQKSLQW